MKFKSFSLAIFLIFAQTLCEQDHPCLNVERMREKICEYAQLIGPGHEFFEKFLQLSEKKQKNKIGKWLSSESYQNEMLPFWNFIIDIVENRKFDEENLEAMDRLVQQVAKKWDYQSKMLCEICGGLVSNQFERNGMKHYKKEFDIKMFFHHLRKEETQGFQDRQKELQELEEKAQKFDSLFEFLDFDQLHEDRIYRGSKKNNNPSYIDKLREEYLEREYQGRI
jgi:hypothetical protein